MGMQSLMLGGGVQYKYEGHERILREMDANMYVDI